MVPSDFITVTDNGMIRIKPPLTKKNRIAVSKNKPAIEVVTGNTNEVKILNEGEHKDADEFKSKRKQTKSMFKELKNKAEDVHERMARLRAMRKNVTVRKKKPVLKDIPDDYDDLIDSGKKSKFIPLKRDGKYNKKDLDF
jgi:predicted transcriptional regulator